MILNVRAVREKQLLTQEKLAQMAGISRTTLSKIESGEDVSVKSETLLSLSEALGTTIDELIFFDRKV